MRTAMYGRVLSSVTLFPTMTLASGVAEVFYITSGNIQRPKYQVIPAQVLRRTKMSVPKWMTLHDCFRLEFKVTKAH
jgi:hypothetical protein